jgi:hypothetical protein
LFAVRFVRRRSGSLPAIAEGGRVSTLTPETLAFHAHLDVCSRCRNRLSDLCMKGCALLVAAVVAAAASIKASPASDNLSHKRQKM